MIFYTIEDWSINPTVQERVSLRDVIAECTGLEDEEIFLVANLQLGEAYNGGEFSITCTGRNI